MLGIEPFLVADAIADFSREDHLIALRQVARTCGVVIASEDLLHMLTQREVVRNVQRLLSDPALQIDPDDELSELGLDSIRHMMLMEQVLFREPQPEFEALVEARSANAIARLLSLQLAQLDVGES